MQAKANTIKVYLSEISAESVDAFTKLRDTILKSIPKGYEEVT